jgi:DNA invertase Pin-like site-specific DNA recombinase
VTVADRIARAGGRLIAEDFDSNAPMGKAILGFLLGWAEEERDARRTGWKTTQEHAAARGVHPTRTPVGYARDDERRLVPGRRGAPRRLHPHARVRAAARTGRGPGRRERLKERGDLQAIP